MANYAFFALIGIFTRLTALYLAFRFADLILFIITIITFTAFIGS